MELIGKTLGIVGMGLTGIRLAELVQPLNMEVLSWDRQLYRMEGVRRQSIHEVLRKSEFLVLLLPSTEEYHNFLDEKKISSLHEGVVVVNLSGEEVVDEKALAKAVNQGKISQYLGEKDSTHNSPLAKMEQAHLLKPYSQLTKEAGARNRQAWVTAIANLAGKGSS